MDAFNLDLTGFNLDDLTQLYDALPSCSQDEDIDDVPEIPTEIVAKPGDLWRLGPYRLLCGDATRAQDYASLLEDSKAHMLFN